MDPVVIFKALGHDQRYALFLDLIKSCGSSCCNDISPGETACCVLDLTERHDLAQSTISHHLKILVDAGLVHQERRGTYSVYRINDKTWAAFREHVAAMNICQVVDHCLPGNCTSQD